MYEIKTQNDLTQKYVHVTLVMKGINTKLVRQQPYKRFKEAFKLPYIRFLFLVKLCDVILSYPLKINTQAIQRRSLLDTEIILKEAATIIFFCLT